MRVAFSVRSLSASHALEKLRRAGIPVLSCRAPEKNVLELEIRRKDAKKSFAILRGSCYNIENVRPVGLTRLLAWAAEAAGLLLGILFFAAAVLFSESRVLLVKVEGSGACYEREVRAILRDCGVREFSAMPEDTGEIAARILALPRTEFCALSKRGGILTVNVQCTDSEQPIAVMPLVSTVSGRLVELVVISGTPRKQVGEEVRAGEVLVEACTEFGPALVMARAVIEDTITAEYALPEEEARAQAFLDFGELSDLHIDKTETGWRIEGKKRTVLSLNL